MKRLLGLIVCLGFLSASVTSCDSADMDDAPALKVGVLLATSGPASYIGTPEQTVIAALFQDEYQGVGLDPIYRDTGSDPEAARAAFEEMASDGDVVAVIGPSTSGESIPLASLAAERRLPMLSLGASKSIVFADDGTVREWAFKFAQNDDLAASLLLQAIIEGGRSSIYFLCSNDGFGASGEREFMAALSANGMALNGSSAFPTDLTDSDPHVASISAETDAVVIWGTAGVDLLVQSVKRLRPNARVYLSHGSASQDFITRAGPEAEGVIVVGSRVLVPDYYLTDGNPADDAIREYQRFWADVGSGPPSQFGAHAADALAALVSVLDSGVASEATARRRELVRSRLEGLSFQGVTGHFQFSARDHAGLDESSFQLYRVTYGAFVPYAP